ncbi:hypothetical protein ABK040_002120 [Willaertia magna]
MSIVLDQFYEVSDIFLQNVNQLVLEGSTAVTTTSSYILSSIMDEVGWNSTACKSYDSVSSIMPNSMDLCVWEGWIAWIILIMCLVLFFGLVLTFITWLIFISFQFCKSRLIKTKTFQRREYRSVDDQEIYNRFIGESTNNDSRNALQRREGTKNLFIKCCSLNFYLNILLLTLIAVIGIVFCIMFTISFRQAIEPTYSTLQKTQQVLNSTGTILQNATESLSGFTLYYNLTYQNVSDSIPAGVNYLSLSVKYNPQRLHLEDLIYNILDPASSNLYNTNLEIYKIIDNYNDITANSSINVYNLDDVFNYYNLLTNGLINDMHQSHEHLVTALNYTQYVVDHLNYSKNGFDSTSHNWLDMWTGVFVPLSLTANDTSEKMLKFSNLLQNNPPDNILNNLKLAENIRLAVFIIAFCLILMLFTLGGSYTNYKRSNIGMGCIGFLSCSLIFWFLLFTAASLGLILLILPLCKNGDQFMNVDKLPQFAKESEFIYYFNVTDNLLHCYGNQTVLDALQEMQEGWWASEDDYQNFFNHLIESLEFLNFKDQVMIVVNNGFELLKGMYQMQGNSIPNIGSALEQLKLENQNFLNRVMNDSNYQITTDEQLQRVKEFQQTMSDKLNQILTMTDDVYGKWQNASDWFNEYSFPEFLESYNAGEQFLADHIQMLEPSVNNLINYAQQVGNALLDFRSYSHCGFLGQELNDINNRVCSGLIGISSIGFTASNIIIGILLFALFPLTLVLATSFKYEDN